MVSKDREICLTSLVIRDNNLKPRDSSSCPSLGLQSRGQIITRVMRFIQKLDALSCWEENGRCLGKVFFFFCFLKELRRVVSNNPTILLLGSILNRTENVCAHKNEYTGNCGSVIYSTQSVETPMSIG